MRLQIRALLYRERRVNIKGTAELVSETTTMSDIGTYLRVDICIPDVHLRPKASLQQLVTAQLHPMTSVRLPRVDDSVDAPGVSECCTSSRATALEGIEATCFCKMPELRRMVRIQSV